MANFGTFPNKAELMGIHGEAKSWLFHLWHVSMDACVHVLYVYVIPILVAKGLEWLYLYH